MRRLLFLVSLLAAIIPRLVASPAQPNIVLIYADYIGDGDLGSYKTTDVVTRLQHALDAATASSPSNSR